MAPSLAASSKSHGTDLFFKDYAGWISSKQDMSEIEEIEGKLGGIGAQTGSKENSHS